MRAVIEPTENPGQGQAQESSSHAYPVREYISAMAQELAQMARWDGDDRLAVLLEIAGAQAHGPRPPSGEEAGSPPDRPSDAQLSPT